jgi:hypothetical protein
MERFIEGILAAAQELYPLAVYGYRFLVDMFQALRRMHIMDQRPPLFILRFPAPI